MRNTQKFNNLSPQSPMSKKSGPLLLLLLLLDTLGCFLVPFLAGKGEAAHGSTRPLRAAARHGGRPRPGGRARPAAGADRAASGPPRGPR